MYEAMARRYRPTTFDEVIGQEHVARTLKNAIGADRVAHAFLFCGPHGCGKTSMARIFAKALVCLDGPTATPCGACDLCRDVLRGQDVDVQEIDGASNNGVEQVRALREQAGYVPTRARYKIYIIDEVHMLSVPAFNALLKTLEEPPGHVKFILATTDPHKMPDTVLSRCQRYDFRLVPPPRLAAHFKDLVTREDAQITEDAVEAVAAFSNGSVRDGLVLLDQLLSYSTGEVTREDVERVRGVAAAEAVAGLFDRIHAKDLPGALSIVDEVAQTGTNVGDYLDQLIAFGRDLMMLVSTQSDEGISAYGPAKEILARLGQASTLDQVLLMLDVFVQARTRVRARALSNPLVPLEMAVARLAGVADLEPLGLVAQKLDALATGAPLPPPRDTAAPPTASAPPAPAPATTSRAALTGEAKEAPPPTAAETTDAPAATRSSETIYGALTRDTVAVDKKKVDNVVESQDARRDAPADPSAPPPTTDTPDWPGTFDAPDTAPPMLTDERARKLWPQVLETLQAQKSPDLPYLRDPVRVASMEGDVLTLAAPSFHAELIEDITRRKRIETAAASVFGVPVQLRVTVEHAADAEEPPPEATPARPGPRLSSKARAERDAQNDPAVRLVMDRFQGQVINVEDADGGT